jgi:hypothetical protein
MLRRRGVAATQARFFLAANPEMNWNATPEQMEFNRIVSEYLKQSLGLE